MNLLDLIGDPIARMPDPNKIAAGMGTMPEPGPKVKGPSILDRIGEGLFKSPGGLEGVLSDEDASGARRNAMLSLGANLLQAGGRTTGPAPTLGQAIGGSIQSAQQGYQGALESALKLGILKQQFGDQQKVKAMRAAVFQQHPVPMNASMDEMSTYLEQILPYFIQMNDTETVGKLSELLKSVVANRTNGVKTPQEIRLGDHVVLRDPISGKEVGSYKINPSPKDPNAPDTAEQLRQQRMFQREQQLGDDWRQGTKDHFEVANHYGTVLANANDAKQGNPAANIGLIFSFMKLQDPRSTVREGEYATAQNAAGIPQRLQNLYNKALDGQFLTPEQVDNFVAASKVVAQSWQRRLDQQRKTYQHRAQRWGVDTSIFIDPFEEYNIRGTGSATPKPGENPLLK